MVFVIGMFDSLVWLGIFGEVLFFIYYELFVLEVVIRVGVVILVLDFVFIIGVGLLVVDVVFYVCYYNILVIYVFCWVVDDFGLVFN